MNRYDKKSSLLWFLFSLGIIGFSSAYSFGTWSRPGPGFLPLLCGIILAFLSLIVLLQAFWKDRTAGGEREAAPFLTSRWPKLVAALFILLAYAFLLEPLGYLLITFVFLLSVLKLVEQTRWRTALIEAFLATVFSYSLFEIWLKVQLPRGFWPQFFS